MAYILKIELHRAQELTGWREGKGAEPEGLVNAFTECGFEAEFEEGSTFEKCEQYLKDNRRRRPHVIIDYMDWFGSTDGHYAELVGFTLMGDVLTINPDFLTEPNAGRLTLPREKLWNNWFDYRIDTYELIKRGAIFARRPLR